MWRSQKLRRKLARKTASTMNTFFVERIAAFVQHQAQRRSIPSRYRRRKFESGRLQSDQFEAPARQSHTMAGVVWRGSGAALVSH
jgi:hypothetical protein